MSNLKALYPRTGVQIDEEPGHLPRTKVWKLSYAIGMVTFDAENAKFSPDIQQALEYLNGLYAGSGEFRGRYATLEEFFPDLPARDGGGDPGEIPDHAEIRFYGRERNLVAAEPVLRKLLPKAGYTENDEFLSVVGMFDYPRLSRELAMCIYLRRSDDQPDPLAHRVLQHYLIRSGLKLFQ